MWHWSFIVGHHGPRKARTQTNKIVNLVYHDKKTSYSTSSICSKTQHALNFTSNSNKGTYPGELHVFVLALLYLFKCLHEWRQHSDRLQLLETSVGSVIRFWKRRIMTKCRSLQFCLLDPPIFKAITMFLLFDRKFVLMIFFIIY